MSTTVPRPRREAPARRRDLPLRLIRHDHWTVGLVDRPIDSFLPRGGPPPAVTWLPQRRATYAADPFGLVRGGRLHVFFEEFDHRTGRGTIAHQEIDRGGRVSEPETVIDPGCHASYPFILESEGEVWLVPETADLREVRLYRAVDLPQRWELAARLLTGVPVSDPTIVRHDGRWWLFGTSRGRGVNDSLRVWHAPALIGPWTGHAIDPVKVDVGSSRPGGTPFRHDGSLYRPAQDCSHQYGGRVVINRVDALTPDRYVEVPVATVEPFATAGYPSGLHTLSSVGRMTLIDGNSLRFSASALAGQISRRSVGRA